MNVSAREEHRNEKSRRIAACGVGLCRKCRDGTVRVSRGYWIQFFGLLRARSDALVYRPN